MRGKKAEGRADEGKSSLRLGASAPGLALSEVFSQAIGLMLKAITPGDLVVLCTMLAWGLSGALSALCGKGLIDAAASLARLHDSASLIVCLWWLAAILALQLGSSLVSSLDARRSSWIWGKVAMHCEDSLIKKASSMHYRYFSDQTTINRLTRANNEFAGRIQRVMSGIFSALSGTISALSVLAVLVVVDWRYPLILALACLPSVFLYRLQTWESYMAAVDSTGATRRVWYFLNLLTSRNAMKEIRFGGIHAYLTGRHDEVADEVATIRERVVRRQALFGALGNLARFAGNFLVLLLTAIAILKGSASLGGFALVLSAAGSFQDSLARAANSLADIKDSGRYFRDYLHIMETEDENCPDPMAPGTISQGGDMDIVCRGLCFTYPGNSEATLRSIDLTICQGEKIAIVGENGSGKSTFVSLLCGLYTPSEGSLCIGGRDVGSNRGFVRQVVSTALQDYQRYDMDVAENIRLGNAWRRVSGAEIESASAEMGLDSLVKSWPEGYATKLGLMEAGGQELSGGEWQKIVLARTLVKREARIMILDEPTAALDPPSEAALYSSYGRITGDRTSILVSHRLGSCRIADRILVFHQGRVVEDGSHDRLMALGGRYREMFMAQASWYS